MLLLTVEVHDVVTDIRAAPQVFPPDREDVVAAITGSYLHHLASTASTCGGGGYATTEEERRDLDTTTAPNTTTSNITSSISSKEGGGDTKGTSAESPDPKDLDPMGPAQPKWEWLEVTCDMTYACRGMVSLSVCLSVCLSV